MAKNTVENKTPVKIRRTFSERYYQERVAALMKENREVWAALKQAKQNTDDWKRISERWESAANKWEKNANAERLMGIAALILWPAVWVICKIVEQCLQ